MRGDFNIHSYERVDREQLTCFMEFKLNIEYNELLDLIRQLPAAQVWRLREELATIVKPDNDEQGNSQLRQLLLTGPVMDEIQYQDFIVNRKNFSAWRTN